MNIQLELLPQELEALSKIAQMRHVTVSELVQTAIADWLEQQTRLEQARTLMIELGNGLGEGSAPHDTARNHDRYLYEEPAILAS